MVHSESLHLNISTETLPGIESCQICEQKTRCIPCVVFLCDTNSVGAAQLLLGSVQHVATFPFSEKEDMLKSKCRNPLVLAGHGPLMSLQECHES